jgi:two-component system, NtrC family, sensor histidine kinase PilS
MIAQTQDSKAFWRPIRIFNLYRACIALLILGVHLYFINEAWFDAYDNRLFVKFSIAYIAFAAMAGLMIRARWPSFDRQVTLQVLGDIGFIVALMFAGGGIKSGLGTLLVIVIAAVSMISQGRLALFYASIATIALLLEQSMQILTQTNGYEDYTHAVMLSLSCFATAWLAHSFARRTYLSEILANQQQIDLENLSQINALITQQMQDGVMVLDAEFKLRHHNTQAQKLLNLDLSHWQGESLNHAVMLDDASVLEEIHQHLQIWLTSPLKPNEDYSKLSHAGREIRLRLLAINQDKLQGAVIFLEDWTHMQAQAQQQKLAALGQLTANIAHEIRNPLSAISHASQLLQEEPTREANSDRFLHIIHKNVERLDQIVKNVLELNRRDRVRQQTLMLVPVLNEFHEEFCQTEKIAETHFVVQIAPELDQTSILFDARHLNQILWNLCKNGWRHSQQTRHSLILRLALGQNSSLLALEVIDDGPGISPATQSHLFEPFYTTESTGTGLGLYIAQQLSAANSASLQYTQQQPSTFRLQVKK